jgi:hypothetical protein
MSARLNTAWLRHPSVNRNSAYSVRCRDDDAAASHRKPARVPLRVVGLFQEMHHNRGVRTACIVAAHRLVVVSSRRSAQVLPTDFNFTEFLRSTSPLARECVTRPCACESFIRRRTQCSEADAARLAASFD